MVLQRERPVLIWGTAKPRERVTVEFAGQQRTTTAADDGRWCVRLAPMPANGEGRTLTIRGVNPLTFADVLVGEVWFCSGQSNMEKPLGPRPGQQPTDNFEAEIRAADHPRIRLFQMPRHGRPQEGVDGLRWLPCTPETIVRTQFSAVAYFFGRELQAELDVPIGLIHASYGGTMIEAWTPRQAFAGNPALRPLLDRRYFAWVDGVQATELFASMVAPLAPYTLRGFLWYQGESNHLAGDTAIYATKLRALIASWRDIWKDRRAPFYFAQIAPFAYSKMDPARNPPGPGALPFFWEAQAHVADDVPHTGMIVLTDLAGDATDLHPTNKRDVGLRFARLALHDTYGRRDVVARGPEFARQRVRDGAIELTFRHAAEGLRSRDGAPLTDFTVAGADRKFASAEATIIGPDRVLVRSNAVARPIAVRFAWHEAATPNLVNSAGLPAVPFRTDKWPAEPGETAHP